MKEKRMSTTTNGRTTHQPPTAASAPGSYSRGAVGVLVFAGTLMLVIGVLHVIQGLVALMNNQFYVVGQEYMFEFDLTAWGWTHLAFGLVVALAGAGLFRGAVWARTVAVVLATLSIIGNFLWLPYYPLWSLTIIALATLVIWAATAHGRDVVAK
jgi:hypothetical protein